MSTTRLPNRVKSLPRVVEVVGAHRRYVASIPRRETRDLVPAHIECTPYPPTGSAARRRALDGGAGKFGQRRWEHPIQLPAAALAVWTSLRGHIAQGAGRAPSRPR